MKRVTGWILAMVAAGTAIAGGYLLYSRTADEATCRDRAHVLWKALDAYHAQNDCLPSACVSGEDGRPRHSWRVLLLPCLGENELYSQYRFDEPWDGPHNARLADRCPDCYRCASSTDTSRTSFFAVVGAGSLWSEAEQSPLRPHDLRLLIVEDDARAVCWLDPRDVCAEELSGPQDDPIAVFRAAGGHTAINQYGVITPESTIQDVEPVFSDVEPTSQ